MSEEMPLDNVRKSLSSRKAVLAFRAVFVLIALVLIVDAIKTTQVLEMYDVEFGTLFWFVCVLKITSSAVAVICMLLMGRNWEWSVWIWACVVLGIALAGISIGLNTEFLIRWDVALPWVVLVIAAALRSRFATPWKSAS